MCRRGFTGGKPAPNVEKPTPSRVAKQRIIAANRGVAVGLAGTAREGSRVARVRFPVSHKVSALLCATAVLGQRQGARYFVMLGYCVAARKTCPASLTSQGRPLLPTEIWVAPPHTGFQVLLTSSQPKML